MIMSKQVQVKKGEIPEGWSIEAADFVNRVNSKNKTIIVITKKTK